MSNEVLAFIAGAVMVGLPMTVLYLRTKEERDYFERDRDSFHEIARDMTLAEQAARAQQKIDELPNWLKRPDQRGEKP